MSRRRRGPDRARITMYDVGFGDCFLLSFDYPGDEHRHLLIDCGSSTKKADEMLEVARQIKQDCGGRLDALVVTHRHSDHVSAFGLKQAGAVLGSLDPRVVIQPWTEHPGAETGAKAPPFVLGSAARAHRNALSDAQRFAAHVAADPEGLLGAAGAGTRRDLSFIAELAIHNKTAVERLASMGRSRAYVHTGSESGLERLLPGVTVSVLGPPTLEQSEEIKRQADWIPGEMWKLQADVSHRAALNRPGERGKSSVFPSARTASISHAASTVRWLIDRLDRTHLYDVRAILEHIDDWLNNTSVILLFEFGGRALLFPGDAQVENWLYALEAKSRRNRLQRTTLYKVGHHGSTNATPKSLWQLLERATPGPSGLVALLSTQYHKHHRVPRKSLVDRLREKTELHSTTDLRRRRQLSETYVA